MVENTAKYIPRMRTASGIVATLKELDPGTDVTVNLVRQIIKDGAVPVVRSGNKALVNLDDILSLFQVGGYGRSEPEPETVGGIRRIDPKRRY